ncbi:preprotein translocase subunit SecG [Candidatus Gracilibacteria bacterium CG2_30_37_12]|nr:MAG: preprotein translocase subunit SecG [Candidatus Gracilibacteria bacterium CG2_30_37_12]
MNKIFFIIQIIVSILLILIILVQAKGNGLSIAPGSNDFGKFEKRGAEKTLHITTIVLACIFVVNATIYFFLS